MTLLTNIVRHMGATVVTVPQRGYGSALVGGIDASGLVLFGLDKMHNALPSLD